MTDAEISKELDRLEKDCWDFLNYTASIFETDVKDHFYRITRLKSAFDRRNIDDAPVQLSESVHPVTDRDILVRLGFLTREIKSGTDKDMLGKIIVDALNRGRGYYRATTHGIAHVPPEEVENPEELPKGWLP